LLVIAGAIADDGPAHCVRCDIQVSHVLQDTNVRPLALSVPTTARRESSSSVANPLTQNWGLSVSTPSGRGVETPNTVPCDWSLVTSPGEVSK